MKMISMLRSAAVAALVLGAAVGFSPQSAKAASNIALTGDLQLGSGTATGTANASTLANKAGVITTESVSTAAGATYTETVTDTNVAATDLCLASVTTTGTGTPALSKVTPGAGTLVFIVQNIHATVAFNAALVFTFVCFKP